MKKLLLLFLIISANRVQYSNAQLIPVERRIDWTPGIPGGIPVITAPSENVISFGADSTGKTDSHHAFMAAIRRLPDTGGVVYIPEGTYLLNSTIIINRSNIVIRGAGMNRTRLLSNADDTSIRIAPDSSGAWQRMSEGYSKGSYRIGVENGSVLPEGSLIEIRQDNDPDIMYTRDIWKESWAEHSVGQVFEIKSIEENMITLRTALHHTYSKELNPSARPVSAVKNVGIENLSIRKLKPISHTFSFDRTAYCWMKKVESYMTMRSHVRISSSLGAEIRECYFHKSYNYGGGGHGYGVECANHTCDVLVENNVFDSLRHAMMVQTGANGNVYAYNYSDHVLQGEPGTALNTGWIPPDISVHGHYAYMNLFEGNEVNEIGISDYWGPAGPGNTFLRNQVRGDGIICYDHSKDQNVIGNITTYLINHDGNCTGMLDFRNRVQYEYTVNEPADDHKITSSLYLKKKPDFFNGFNWPPFSPGGPDMTMLPAHKQYDLYQDGIR